MLTSQSFYVTFGILQLDYWLYEIQELLFKCISYKTSVIIKIICLFGFSEEYFDQPFILIFYKHGVILCIKMENGNNW